METDIYDELIKYHIIRSFRDSVLLQTTKSALRKWGMPDDITKLIAPYVFRITVTRNGNMVIVKTYNGEVLEGNIGVYRIDIYNKYVQPEKISELICQYIKEFDIYCDSHRSFEYTRPCQYRAPVANNCVTIVNTHSDRGSTRVSHTHSDRGSTRVSHRCHDATNISEYCNRIKPVAELKYTVSGNDIQCTRHIKYYNVMKLRYANGILVNTNKMTFNRQIYADNKLCSDPDKSYPLDNIEICYEWQKHGITLYQYFIRAIDHNQFRVFIYICGRPTYNLSMDRYHHVSQCCFITNNQIYKLVESDDRFIPFKLTRGDFHLLRQSLSWKKRYLTACGDVIYGHTSTV